jgi:hypothetical protein
LECTLETLLVTVPDFQRDLVGPRAGTSSRLVGAAAVIALIAVASLSVVIINSSDLTDPVQREILRPVDSPLPKPGTLSVHIFSNQDFSSVVSDPLNVSLPLSNWPVAVATINSSIISVMPLPLATDANGTATVSLLPGSYLLLAPYNTLNIQIFVRIYTGNTTSVQLNIFESAYPLLYSEADDAGAQPIVYVEVRSPTPVADAGNPITLGVKGEGPGGGHQLEAVIISQSPPAQGTEWLKLEPVGGFNLANSTTVILSTWRYTSSVTVGPTGANALQGV